MYINKSFCFRMWQQSMRVGPVGLERIVSWFRIHQGVYGRMWSQSNNQHHCLHHHHHRDHSQQYRYHNQHMRHQVTGISLPNYKHASNTSSHCIFNRCVNHSLHLIPMFIKRILIQEHNFYSLLLLSCYDTSMVSWLGQVPSQCASTSSIFRKCFGFRSRALLFSFSPTFMN